MGATQGDPGIEKIKSVVGRDFGMLMMGYPNGSPDNANGDLSHTAQVLIVGVTDDQTVATTAIRRVFHGNLCVVHSDRSDAEVQQQFNAIQKALGNHMIDYGVMMTGPRVQKIGTQTNEVSIVVDTPELEAKISSIPGPPITVNPWIVPLS